MNHDPRLPREPLTPEERALAERLARLGPHGEPSPALDARILDAARATAEAPASASASRSSGAAVRRHRRRRWPVAIGTAATLVVVGGLAWQLRPVDDMQVAYSEAPRAVSGPSADATTPVVRQRETAPAAARTAAPAVTDTAPQPSAADAAGAAPAPEPPADTSRELREQQRVARPVPQPQPAPPPEPPVVFDAPSPMDTPAPPPAPPAPPAPAAPVAPAPAPPTKASPTAAAVEPEPEADAAEASAAKAGLQRAERAAMPARRAPQPAVASGTTAHPAPPVAAATAAADAGELDRIVVTGTRHADGFTDQPIDDEPPASADSPQVQDAWLRRVRQLVSEGRLEEARESLREYRHRYPEATLPEDLRALLDD